MGKQWLLYKVAGDGGAGGCHGTAKSSSTTTNKTKAAGKSRKRGEKHSSSSSSSGCMSAIFHLFDIQHHHFPFQQHHFISDSFINIPPEPNFALKGVEAPRNSLELEEPMVEEVFSSSSSSSKPKQGPNLNIPMGGIQIKTKRSRFMDDVSSECSSSPGTKTPNLVARLMGLDLLPENSSPRPSLSSPRPSSSSSHATPLNPLSNLSSHKQHTRSLPVTPRISMAARPSTEVDYHHRLSLQINKENCMNRQRSELLVNRREGDSTSEYAKQIAKQVRESISRRVGADITNTMTVKKKEQRRDECLVLLKSKRPSPTPSPPPAPPSATTKQDESALLSCSPRLRLLEIKNKLDKPISNPPLSSSSSTELIKAPSSSTTKSPPLIKQEVQLKQEKRPIKVKKCKRIASEKYDLRLKKMHQQEEPFVKKCKKKSTPLSNHLLNVNTTTKFISFKKDMASPSSAARLPQNQVPFESITQLPSCQSRSYKTKETHKLSVQDNVSTREDNYSNGKGVTTTVATGGSVSDQFEYISRILSHSGIDKNTPISITHWYSPSHPLHPSVFDQLEKLFHPTTTTNAVTRKLIFEVVDELLVEILKPYISFKPWATRLGSYRMHGSELIAKLCEKIRSFPAADCRVLEDIDGLIEGDMSSSTRVMGVIAFEEEAEELVTEMERDMVDTVVNEMAGMMWHLGCRGRV